LMLTESLVMGFFMYLLPKQGNNQQAMFNFQYSSGRRI
jgi:hypothetical protein